MSNSSDVSYSWINSLTQGLNGSRQCTVNGNYLYVAWNDRSQLTKDISIYDISNPSDPSLKATITPTEIEPPIMALSINNGRMMVGVSCASVSGAGYYIYDLN